MEPTTDPIVKLQPGGKASILNYNVPERVSYGGRAVVELVLDDPAISTKNPVKVDVPGAKSPKYAYQDGIDGKGWFKPEFYQTRNYVSLPPLDDDTINADVIKLIDTGVVSKALLGSLRLNDFGRLNASIIPSKVFVPASATSPQLLSAQLAVDTTIKPDARTILASIDKDELLTRIKAEQIIRFAPNMFGNLQPVYLKPKSVAKPGFFLIETYQLSSYLGDYGAGRTLSTFSLLPGEKTKISIKTFKSTESEKKAASNVLDSFENESANEFEKDMASERSDKQSAEDASEWFINAEASGGFNIGIAKASVKVNGGYKGSSRAARETFANDTAKATEKSTARSSAKRQVEVNTTSTETQKQSVETSIERVLENINVSRTLNFVFRQMNQEFITLLHMVDVKIGFYNGFEQTQRILPLYMLDSLLDDVLNSNDPGGANRAAVRKAILGELEEVYDYLQQPHTVYKEKRLRDDDGNESMKTYLSLDMQTSVYQPPGRETTIPLPGVILSENKYTMRTDGVIVEALLGQAEALDDYSKGLQAQAVEEKMIANCISKAQLQRELLAQQIVQDKDEAAAKLFAKVFPPPLAKVPLKIVPVVDNGADDNS